MHLSAEPLNDKQITFESTPNDFFDILRPEAQHWSKSNCRIFKINFKLFCLGSTIKIGWNQKGNFGDINHEINIMIVEKNTSQRFGQFPNERRFVHLSLS